MNQRTKEFLEKFKEYPNDSIEVAFTDSFSEFIEILNSCDLSEKTLEYLNDIFEKDLKRFLRNSK